MKNFVQEGTVTELTAPYARNAGEGALIGAIFGIAVNTVANAAKGQFRVGRGVVTHAKAASQAWTEGSKIYWDNTNKVMSNVSTSNTFVGYAAAAVAGGAGDTTGTVLLHGAPT